MDKKKKKYELGTMFFVVFAVNKWEYGDFNRLCKIGNRNLRIDNHIILDKYKSDAEIANILLNELEDMYGDGLKTRQITLVNWWV